MKKCRRDSLTLIHIAKFANTSFLWMQKAIAYDLIISFAQTYCSMVLVINEGIFQFHVKIPIAFALKKAENTREKMKNVMKEVFSYHMSCRVSWLHFTTVSRFLRVKLSFLLLILL